jgi:uncharacterized membrane protein YedE/YeeE
MTTFTPLQSLLGGWLIGFAAVLLMLLHGRIAGITGILSGVLPPYIAPDWRWRAAFLAGMVAAPLAAIITGSGAPPFQSSAPSALLLVSGVLVGIGVTFGAGCTSGHGVCGLSRFSVRSLVAVVTFMATSAATVFVVRHIVGG